MFVLNLLNYLPDATPSCSGKVSTTGKEASTAMRLPADETSPHTVIDCPSSTPASSVLRIMSTGVTVWISYYASMLACNNLTVSCT